MLKRSFSRLRNGVAPRGTCSLALALLLGAFWSGCSNGDSEPNSETGGSTQTGIGGSGGVGTPSSGSGGAGTTGSAGAPVGPTGVGGTAAGPSGSAGAGGTGETAGTAGTGGAGETGGTGARDGGSNVGSGAGGSSSDGGRGGSGGSGAGGTSAGGACNVAPVDPAATPQAKNLLCYLHSIYGNHVLSGQQETSWSNPAGDIDYYVKTVGKYPAILGGDYLYPSGTTSRAQAYGMAGGITMIRYHMGAPPLSDTYQNSEMSTNYANVLTSGTTENKSLLSKLDYLAGELKTLQSANVPVILALFHEVQSNGWFWWAKGTGAQFVQLWQLSFQYITVTKGIHNVIWLVPFSGSPNAAYFPGKTYADLCGPDEYSQPGGQPFSGNYKSAANIVGTTFPIPLHETGTIPQPASMFPSTAPWLLWNVWAGYENTAQGGVSYNTASSIQTAYSSPYTITRDELPKF